MLLIGAGRRGRGVGHGCVSMRPSRASRFRGQEQTRSAPAVERRLEGSGAETPICHEVLFS